MNYISVNRGYSGKQGIFYGWFVLAGIFIVTAVCCGAFYSFGVFFVPVMTEFGWSRGATSGIVFVSGITYALTVPLIGAAADKYNFKMVAAVAAGIMGLGFVLASQAQTIWHFYLFLGIFIGIGACAAIPLPLSMTTRWFVRRRGLALGLASAGIGTGAALVPLLTAYLISSFGWRTALMSLGLMIWLSYLPILLFVIRVPDADYVKIFEGEEPSHGIASGSSSLDQRFTLVQAALTSQFWILFAVFTFCILSLSSVMTHVVPYALDMGLSAIKAASILTIAGASSISGRIGAGILSDKVGSKTVLLLGLALQGTMIFWLSRANQSWMFYLFAVIFGVAYGANLVMIPKLTASIFGARSMGSVFGGLSVGDGLGFAVGPLFVGYVFDIFGSYHLSFSSIAIGLFFVVCLTVFLKTKSD